MSIFNNLPRGDIAQALWAHRRAWAVVILFSMVVSVLLLTPTLYMLQVYDRVMVSQSEITLLVVSLIGLTMLPYAAAPLWRGIFANPQIGDLYIPVADGAVEKFGQTVKEIGLIFAELVNKVANNQVQAPNQHQSIRSIAAKTSAIGYAMQMDFLGRRSAAQAPQLVTAWTADHDLTNPALPAFQVCVLLTKLQPPRRSLSGTCCSTSCRLHQANLRGWTW